MTTNVIPLHPDLGINAEREALAADQEFPDLLRTGTTSGFALDHSDGSRVIG